MTLEDLIELWVKYYDRLAEEDRQRLPLKPVYFLARTD
jgi:predicted Mrr-cat superfamily restriction endonuclease